MLRFATRERNADVAAVHDVLWLVLQVDQTSHACACNVDMKKRCATFSTIQRTAADGYGDA